MTNAPVVNVVPTTAPAVSFTTAKAVQTLFKFKQNESFDTDNINTDGIEHASAVSVSNAIVDALVKDGTITQYYDKEVSKREYLFSASFDLKLVALVGTQLAMPIMLMNEEFTLSAVSESTIVWKHFRNLARANNPIMNCFEPEKDNKAFWAGKALKGLEMAAKANLITETSPGLWTRSTKFLGMCIKRSSIAHATEAITLETRRKERVKGQYDAKKDSTSTAVRKALGFIESQAFQVNARLLDAIVEVRTWFEEDTNPLELPLCLKSANHVINGCAELRDEPELFSEYFMDPRGRMYQFAHYGPNPQGADIAKALAYHTVKEITLKGSEAYHVFMAEFKNEVVGDFTKLLEMDVIRWVASNPARALKKFLTDSDYSKFKKLFTYVDMCATYVDFEDNNQAVCQLGFGPDAKTSGAQILAILAGDADVARACGLTDLADRLEDLYKQSAKEVAILCKADVRFAHLLEITRPEIKTPFMAIQYAGGVPALRYKEFEHVLERIGVPMLQRDIFCEEIVIAGVMQALGGKIQALLGSFQDGVADVLAETNQTSFTYRHIDGFKCTKKGEATVRVSFEHFHISLGDGGNGVIFGATEEAKGGEAGWSVRSTIEGHLEKANFAYYFPVHFVQGLDAVMARAIALRVQDLGLRGYSTIHDQFRVCLNDAPKMLTEVVPHVYEEMFIKNNPLEHLMAQVPNLHLHNGTIGGIENIVTVEKLQSSNAYYFE